MTADRSLNAYLARYPYAAAGGYFALVVALLVTIWLALAGMLQDRAALADARDILGKLETRQQSADARNSPAGAVPAGSPFVGGETITVAGATLLQRVAGAVARFGGTVQSSQVDLQGQQSKDGFVTLLISCEMEQSNLQKLLYDLEAGMPFLFIDQLVVQAPRESATAAATRMRLLITVSGQWKGTK